MRTTLMALLAASALISSPATAGQRPYSQYDIFQIYEEDNGCTMYVDYDNDTMLRLSYRPDQHRVYFNVVNPQWSSLARVAARKDIIVTLAFNPDQYGYVMAGQVINNSRGWGLAGGDTPDEEFLDRLASSTTLTVKMQISKEETSLGQMTLGSNPAEAVAQLRRCNERRGSQ